MNNIELFENIDNCFSKTSEKYGAEQLLGAILNYIIKKDITSFTDKTKRTLIEKIGIKNIKKALLINVVKLDANVGITNLRNIDTFSKNYDNHQVGETELRIIQTLLLSNNQKFNKKAIKEADYIISNEANSLINIIKSFIETRYIKKFKIDTPIYDLKYLDIIDNINKYYLDN